MFFLGFFLCVCVIMCQRALYTQRVQSSSPTMKGTSLLLNARQRESWNATLKKFLKSTDGKVRQTRFGKICVERLMTNAGVLEVNAPKSITCDESSSYCISKTINHWERRPFLHSVVNFGWPSSCLCLCSARENNFQIILHPNAVMLYLPHSWLFCCCC